MKDALRAAKSDALVIINAERTNGTLVYIGDEACGCPLYRVAEGRVSEYMRQHDLLCMHNVGCAELADTRGTIEWFGNR